MTSTQVVYDAFLAKMLEDEWANWDMEAIQADWRAILDGALPYFKFPKQDLTIQNENFLGDLNNTEVQILASYMKCEWLNRTILTWENVKPLYEERDFSQANLLDKFQALLENEKKNARYLESIYYRSINSKPFDYTKLATTNE